MADGAAAVAVASLCLCSRPLKGLDEIDVQARPSRPLCAPSPAHLGRRVLVFCFCISQSRSRLQVPVGGMNSSSFRDAPLDARQLAVLAQHAFAADGSVESDDSARSVFLAHQWFLESSELLAQFVSIVEEATSGDERRKAAYAVAYWIHQFPMHFEGNVVLCRLVERMRSSLGEEGDLDDDLAVQLDVSALPSYAWLRNVSVRNPVARQVSLSFEQWSPDDISASLSHIDYKVLSRITIVELKRYVRENSLTNTPILERSISVFNNITNWVQCMVLSKSTPKERADILVKFVNVCKHLRKLSNFNTLMAVVGGITHSNIARLSKTNALVPAEMKKELAQFTQLLSMQSNYAQYRRALAETKGKFRMPIMGVHLKDLIATQCKWGDSERTTRRKLSLLASLLSHFLIFNRIPHHFPDPNIDLINTLKVSLDMRYNEEDIYEQSLRREPRTLLSFSTGTTGSVVFADWASGVSAAPDPDTVNKHVSAMVDAVFKHYDHDRDGCISQAEFRQIAGNFPFIDPFVTIDVDRDGQISKKEMKAYFVKLNKQSTEFRRGFKHNFHETTFLAPTTCGHCNKVLWGLIRQGFKCKDCGLSVHGLCKDQAVAECRRRSTTISGLADWWHSPRGTHNGRSFTHRPRLFLTTKKPRTVSTVSEAPSPEPSVPECSHSAHLPLPVVTARVNRLHVPSKGRAASESADCYSPDSTVDEGVGVASLACEEVFEDDFSTSENQSMDEKVPNGEVT